LGLSSSKSGTDNKWNISKHVDEGGINELTFEVSEGNLQTFFLQDTKNMQKLSGRVPGTIYGKDF
jgi:uncharacterized protein involved in type VI secretion and phage assembly